MDNNLFQRLKDLIEANQTIGIITSSQPTFDELAAGLGLYLALKQMGKNVTIVSPSDVTVGVSSLVGIDKVQKSFGGVGQDLVVSFPYKEGEIEKVSYNVDNGKLQIVIKAGPQGLSFNRNDIDFQQGGGVSGVAPSLLFYVGVADKNSIANVVNPTPGTTTVVNIDNKSQNTKYGDVVHVDSRFSSVSEEVADFLTLLEPQIELDTDSSQNLLSGILSATNNFEANKGSYLSFEMAGILMKKGAVRSATGMARPTTTQMPTTNYFPPQPNVVSPAPTMPQQPVQQPQAQPGQNMPTPNLGNMFTPTMPAQQPVSQPVQPISQPQAQPASQPPADWLTPKVYKGSTVV